VRTCPDLKKGKEMGKETAPVNTASVEPLPALKLPVVNLEINTRRWEQDGCLFAGYRS
jgi:hypothetical protein